MSDENKNSSDPMTEGKLNAIKEIIFGENIKAYENEFKELKDIIKDQRKEIDKDIASMKKEIEKSLEGLRSDMDKSITKVKGELSKLDDSATSRQKLGDFLEDLARKIKE